VYGGVLLGVGRVNKDDEGEGMWLMDFVYAIEQRKLLRSWGGRGLRGTDEGVI
jgi:hypothetical protein